MQYDKACKIAFENYFKPLSLELVPKGSQAMLFDIAFNMGPKRAVILAQRALKLTDDGIAGKMTKEKLPYLCKILLNEERVKYFKAIVKSNASQSKFLKGWLNRADYFLKNNI